MAQSVPRDVLLKIRKLAQLATDLRQGKHFPVTRLTILKSLCQEPDVANRFVLVLARKTQERVKQGKGRSSHKTGKGLAHRQLMTEALTELEAWQQRPTEARRQRLLELLGQMRQEQNQFQPVPFAMVRIIHDWDFLLLEEALHCVLEPWAASHWLYQVAKDYAERSDARTSDGLTSRSAPLVQDIVEFFADYYGVDLEAGLAMVQKAVKQTRPQAVRARRGKRSGRVNGNKKEGGIRFTHLQGQYLAFIHLYRKLHLQGPAELDMVQYFRVTPPSVHGMVVRLEEMGLITREPGVARSIRVAIPEDEIPKLV
jgi:hypothetical protein